MKKQKNVKKQGKRQKNYIGRVFRLVQYYRLSQEELYWGIFNKSVLKGLGPSAKVRVPKNYNRAKLFPQRTGNRQKDNTLVQLFYSQRNFLSFYYLKFKIFRGIKQR